jgi:hypothetical protein
MNAMDASPSSRSGTYCRQAATLAAFALASISFSATALAQGKNTFVVVGVADASSGEALKGAEILFPTLGRSVRADAMGEAKIADIPTGNQRIRVRFLGYVAADTTLQFQGDTTGIVFRLDRMAISLNPVEVKAKTDARLKDFEMRKRIGTGRYLTANDLEKDAGRDFGIVAMSRFPGLKLVHDGDGRPHIASSRGSCGVASTLNDALRPAAKTGGSGGRGTSAAGGADQGTKGGGNLDDPIGTATSVGSCSPNKACLVQAYLDDVLLDEADFDIISTWDLAGVEYYTGSTMPARYRVSGSACGVMLLWSK